ncbi:MAG: right-handed parallel beta-helix repeat-containing protein [Planctomycetales bacterium]|nr:right-handed parallel beta-helix repeat-containing protein [Planctomycetales bacterium]
MSSHLCCCLTVWFTLVSPTQADIVLVRDAANLKTALPALADGTTLRLAPGNYPGELAVKDVANLTVEAADPDKPPHFIGGNYAWHFSGCSNLKLRHLRISGQSHNGLNLDDGGRADRPMKNVALKRLDISDIGPKGNFDGIKCSGLEDVAINDCMVEGWGGQAIDLVGCHRVVISACKFTGKPSHSQASGVQCKGGSEDVTIEKCHFFDAGQRPINAGGSTGLAYFRPVGAKYEARRVNIRKNVISGSLCACAFTGVDGAEFTGNTILFPEKWVFRILQETTDDSFVPCRNVLVDNNAIVFRRSKVGDEVNIGAKTSPESFRFSKNQWFADDRPDRSRPKLPSEEKDGTYGSDPRVKK